MIAAVAAGAFAAAGQSGNLQSHQQSTEENITPLASGKGAAASLGAVAQPSGTGEQPAGSVGQHESFNGMGGSAPAPEILPVSKDTNASDEAQKLAKSERVTAQRVAAEEEAKRPRYISPADGRFTSGFGGRWGTTHYGIDIANSKGTPIRSVADGQVIEAGPASGFGMWVRVLHDDGTTTVYGHVNSTNAEEGERVQAGDQIATMGSRGFSTGTHLHFEVWNTSGKKINPLPWLEEHGVHIPGASS